MLTKLLSDLIFSINTVLPVFIVVLVGWYIRRHGTVDDHFVGSVSNVVFYYALPAMMFQDVAKSDFTRLANPRFMAVTLLGTLAVFILSWVLIALVYKDPRITGAAAHAAYRGNFIYIGLPIIENILQTAQAPACTILVITFVLPLYNILAVILLSVCSGDTSGLRPGRLLINILKNPMIIAVIAGLAYGLTGLPIPSAADRALDYLGAIASPLALLMVGARMADSSGMKKNGAVILAAVIKLIISPLLGTAAALLLHMPADETVTVFVLFGVPTALNVFIMTRSMGGDDEIAAHAIVTAVFGSTVTMTAGIMILRMLQVI